MLLNEAELTALTPIERMHAYVRLEDHVPAIDNYPQIETVPCTNRDRISRCELQPRLQIHY